MVLVSLAWVGVAVGQRVAVVVHLLDVLGESLGPVVHGKWTPASTRVRCGGDDIRYVIGICQKAMRKTARWYVSQAGKREQKAAIHTRRCMISFTIDSIGATYDACVGDDGPVGEGGRAMRSRSANWTVQIG